jgi:hypothetical protein
MGQATIDMLSKAKMRCAHLTGLCCSLAAALCVLVLIPLDEPVSFHNSVP